MVDASIIDECELPNYWKGRLYEGVTASGQPVLLPETQATSAEYARWQESLREVIRQARKGWVKHSSDASSKTHSSKLDRSCSHEPHWWEGNFEDLIESAFAGKIIDRNHSLGRAKRVIQTSFDDDDIEELAPF